MHNKRREMNPPHKECQGEDEGGEKPSVYATQGDEYLCANESGSSTL